MTQVRTRVKMCGTTRLEDALAAVRYGVDALGFIMYPQSPRYITPGNVRLIADQLPPFLDRVGVLVNERIETAVQLVDAGGFSYLQLHGSESAHYCREMKQALPHLKIIKAFRVGNQSRQEEFEPYEECVDGFLLDTYVKGEKGGTGEMFDWSLVAKLNLKCHVILAGGLSPENIVSAIQTVRPYCVDVNSGVETEPGKKNHGRLRQIMALIADTTLL